MAVERPVEHVELRADSIADDLAYAGLLDAANILQGHADARLIGGLMMTIHQARWRLPTAFSRETRDVDVATPILAAPMFEELDMALEKAGYKPAKHYSYVRTADDVDIGGMNPAPSLRVTIDLLQVPAVGLGGVPSSVAGSGTLDPVALVEALERPAVLVHTTVSRRNGIEKTIRLPLADEASAVIMKASSWRSRRSSRDLHDLWRALEIAYSAGCVAQDFSALASRIVGEVLDQALGEPADQAIVTLAAAQQMSPQEGRTRIAALRQHLGL